MTFKTDAEESARETAATRHALFSVAEVTFTIACPYRSERQTAPSDDSDTWKKHDVARTGMGRLVQCEDCKRFFTLPPKLFDIIAGA
jgi:hypothetical protein